MRFRRLALPCLAGWLAVAVPMTPIRASEVDPEDYRALKARVASFDEFVAQNRVSLQSLRTEIARLRAENDVLRAQAGAARGAASQEQLGRLASQVQEIERNRTRDKQQVLDAIDRLKNLAPAPVAPRPPAKGTPGKKVPAKKAAKPAPPKKPAPAPASTTSPAPR